ncbi:putative CCR4-associated factor 1 homolog 8 [Mangifera indica]|uniref:putative CCR4-associated factor 1 homolog 8 n=1 Tax=Mangifera indica TaxID=29780 RepID=UPI001CFA61EB|nr:putative CCR4-associated factor 1 homolog 8 [Mangifera indica]
MKEIREVWGSNVDSELQFFDQCLERFNFLSFDTEFPGFLQNTPRDAPESLRYSDLKFNVDLMKLIQLGITLSDGKGNICCTWEFNFSDFDLERDLHSEGSIDLLKNCGINFEKIRKYGVSSEVFVPKFLHILSRHRNIKWVTFHGLYDLAYVLKLLMNKPMPRSLFEFLEVASMVFGCVFDIKFMAKHCNGLLGGEIGLNKVAKILGVERKGAAHNAGSDSFLIATIFAKVNMMPGFQERDFSGCLYGISSRIGRLMEMVLPCYSQLMVVAPARPPQAVIFCPRLVICPLPVICPATVTILYNV